MTRRLAAAAVCGMAVSAAIAHITRNKWIEVPLEGLLTACFAAPAAFLSLVTLAWKGRARQAWLRKTGESCRVLLVFVAFLWVGIPLRMAFSWHDQKIAREFCESLVPTIERYHAEHAGYPEEINWMVAAQGNGEPPKLIENGFQYHRRADSFILTFIAPDHPFAWHVFESNRRAWGLEYD